MDFFYTHVSEKAIELATETLRSGFLSEGRRVAQFESALSEQLGLSFPVTTTSGTSALHLALMTLQVRKGDEVITSPQSFIATALAILHAGAIPVFADINPKTGNLDPESIQDKITDKTIAIMPVCYGGLPYDVDEVNAIAETNALAVVDDACQALGAVYKGKPIGSGLTDATCFSFQATKNLPVGDGGCVCFPNEFYADLARKYRWFGIDRANTPPTPLGERDYVLNEGMLGWKFHLDDLRASVGLGNLTDFSERHMKRVQNSIRYDLALEHVAGLELLDYKKDRLSSYYLYPVLVEQRLDFVRKLKERGIPALRVHGRIDRHPLLSPSGINHDLVGQAEFEEKHVCLPVHEALSDSDISHIIETIKEGW